MDVYNKQIKVAMLFPYAPAYREAIYCKIDETFDTKWFLCGNAKRPLKLLDYSILKNKDITLVEKRMKGGIYYINRFHPSLFNKFDVVIFSGNIRNLSYWKLLFRPRWKNVGPKLLLWTHGWYGKESTLIKFIKKIYYKRADGLLLYGNYAKNLMIQEGFDSSKLFVIKNSLNYDKQLTLRNSIIESNLYKEKFSNTYPVIIFIGRLIPEKKLDMVISALGALKKDNRYFNLVFIGDGPVKSDLENLARLEGIENNVLFWGACYDERVNAELIYNADLCVSPGNVGLTAIHSLMFGCPVISNKDFPRQGPEFESIKPGRTGQFFAKGSVDSLTTTIREWFDGPGKDREKIRQACYDEIDSFWNPNYQMEILDSVFRQLGLK